MSDQGDGSGSAWILIGLAHWTWIRIRIEINNWILIRIPIQTNEDPQHCFKDISLAIRKVICNWVGGFEFEGMNIVIVFRMVSGFFVYGYICWTIV
jgi:hypothetical protein